MANFYSTQYNNAYVAVPSVNIVPGDQSGDVRHAAFDVTLSGVITTSDVVKLCQIPKGAKLIGVVIKTSAMTSGALNLGWAASADGAQSGAATGVASAIAVSSAAVNTYYPLQEMAGAVDLQAVPSTNTGAAGTINGFALYVVI